MNKSVKFKNAASLSIFALTLFTALGTSIGQGTRTILGTAVAYGGEANGEGGAAGGGTGADASGGNSGAPGVGGGNSPGGSNGGSTGSNGGVGGANGSAGYGGFGGLGDNGQTYNFGVPSQVGTQPSVRMAMNDIAAEVPGLVVQIDLATGKVISAIPSLTPVLDAATIQDDINHSGLNSDGGIMALGVRSH